jgi:Concanavalin A-like lectin/glucanases superfamily
MNTSAWRDLKPAVDLTQGSYTELSIAPFSASIAEQTPRSIRFLDGEVGDARRLYTTTHWTTQHGTLPLFPLESAIWQIDMWIKYKQFYKSTDLIVLFSKELGSTKYIRLTINNSNQLALGLTIGGILNTFVHPLPMQDGNIWQHVGVQYDKVGTLITVSLIINGQAVPFTLVSTPAIDTNVGSVIVLGTSTGPSSNTEYQIDELRLWSILQPREYFLYEVPKQRVLGGAVGFDTDVISNGLWGYWKFRESNVPFKNSVEEYYNEPTRFFSFTNVSTDVEVASDGYPHTFSQQSIIVGKTSLRTLGANFSFNTKQPNWPSLPNYSLFVSWADKNGNRVRRALWVTAGYVGDYIRYTNEPIQYFDAELEYYNDYTLNTISAPEAFSLRMSFISSFADYIPTPPSSISMSFAPEVFALFPLTFPVIFDQKIPITDL